MTDWQAFWDHFDQEAAGNFPELGEGVERQGFVVLVLEGIELEILA